MTTIIYRVPKAIHLQMLSDLTRPHDHAAERIGFLFTRSKKLKDGSVLIIATEYIPVPDNQYIEDNEVGARINGDAIRFAMQKSRSEQCGVFHIHLHNHKGKPCMSWTDKDGIPPMIESFTNVAPEQSHGILILSRDSLMIDVLNPGEEGYRQPQLISIIGYPGRFFLSGGQSSGKEEMYDRQSFLGPDAQTYLANIRVGIIGYGGGGSHVGLQLAHIGVGNQVIFDDDHIEESNLNRLVGGWAKDVTKASKKTLIAERTIKNVLPNAMVQIVSSRWQVNPEVLQKCDIVVGCVDSYLEREQLEAECRRYLIPLIDIGMDVHSSGTEAFVMSGQVILSMPGGACMRCMKFVTDENLAKEAARYGKVGGKPQVVWPNGVLASTAVGIVVDIISGWTARKDPKIYLAYDGNFGTMSDHLRLNYTPEVCSHHPLTEAGEPRFKKL